MFRLVLLLKKLRGRWRLWWGFCPHCNSDAPELYDCPVCEYYRGAYPPSPETKQRWWSRFVNELYVPPGYREFVQWMLTVRNKDGNPEEPPSGKQRCKPVSRHGSPGNGDY